jgi:(1->4)-alpha-D-glucan 1-alpha-D-glucosylmutase
VDFARRQEMLRELDARLAEAGPDRRELARELIRVKEDGRVKLYVTAQALRCRREHTGLFTTGDYLPAEAEGALGDHVIGFARRYGGEVAAAVVPRLMTRLAAGPEGLPLGAAAWQNTRLLLPSVEARLGWRNIFTGSTLPGSREQGPAALPLAEVFADFPVALLLAQR